MSTKNKDTELIKRLTSGNSELIKTAIKEIRRDGKDSLLKPLAEAYDLTKDIKIKSEIERLFSDLKNQDSVLEFMQIINTTESLSIKKMLVSACWQSRLNFTDYFSDFILIAFEADFELAFEAFTVIESNEIKINKTKKEKLITFAKANISKTSEPNMALASDIVKIIEQYEE